MTDELETPVDEDGIDVKAIVDEAREDFELVEGIVDALKGRNMRTRKLDLGYDEVNGEKLDGIESALIQLGQILDNAASNADRIAPFKAELAKVKKSLKTASAEAAGPLEETKAHLERQIAECEAIVEEIAPLRAKQKEMDAAAQEIRDAVNKDSISIELRALPYTIARGAARRARKALGITQKGIPEELQEEYDERQMIELAYDQVARYRDNKTGESGSKLTIEQIETIRDYMPLSQSTKFFRAVNDLQYTNAISETAIAQADF